MQLQVTWTQGVQGVDALRLSNWHPLEASEGTKGTNCDPPGKGIKTSKIFKNTENCGISRGMDSCNRFNTWCPPKSWPIQSFMPNLGPRHNHTPQRSCLWHSPKHSSLTFQRIGEMATCVVSWINCLITLHQKNKTLKLNLGLTIYINLKWASSIWKWIWMEHQRNVSLGCSLKPVWKFSAERQKFCKEPSSGCGDSFVEVTLRTCWSNVSSWDVTHLGSASC